MAGIDEAVQLMGVQGFWGQAAHKMPQPCAANELREKLRQYVRRRNQIVHEADLERRIKARKYAIRSIEKEYAVACCDFITKFVAAADEVIDGK